MSLATKSIIKSTASASSSRQSDTDSGHRRTSNSESGSSSLDDENHKSDCFADATDEISLEEPSLNEAAVGSGELADATSQLGRRLEDTILILRKALNNEFVLALELCSNRDERDLYASLAHATLSFLRAALTLEPNDLQAALSSIQFSFEVSSERRRKTSAAAMMMRLLYKPNYETYTDLEVHAELVHAESLLMLSLVSFLADQSILCLVRGAFRIRACYQRYKECLIIMESRQSWSSEAAKRHFESGVRMGHGIFNLLMSYMPRRVLRFLQYVGFSGNRTLAVDELERSIQLDDGLRSVFSTLVVLTYHSYVENLFGLGAYDELKVEQLNKSLQIHYPKSAFYLLFKGRYHQMQGNLNEAIKTFELCIASQNDWRQFHAICYWEIMWCYAVQMDWPKAAHYADLLRSGNKWSPASYNYQYATFLYAQLVEDQRAGLCSPESQEYNQRMTNIRKIMKRVPELRIRYAGKTIPAEKFAITRSERFLKQANRLSLPALEFLYIWNVFCTLANAPKQVEQLLTRIDSEIEFVERQLHQSDTTTASSHQKEFTEPEDSQEIKEENQESWTDDLSLLLLLKGMCQKHLGQFKQAEESFIQVVELEDNIKNDTFLVPHSAMELAILNLTLKRYESARQWVKMARNNFTGYLLETIVHFRLHAASRTIRMEQDLECNGSAHSIKPSELKVTPKFEIELKN